MEGAASQNRSCVMGNVHGRKLQGPKFDFSLSNENAETPSGRGQNQIISMYTCFIAIDTKLRFQKSHIVKCDSMIESKRHAGYGILRNNSN